jgi:hypothetical protein
MNWQFNPWITNQKYRHQSKHWFEGPDKECWCLKQLTAKEDKCKDCYEDYFRWETIQTIPIREIKNVQSFLVSRGAEELTHNEYNYIVQNLVEKYPKVVVSDLTQLGRTSVVTHRIDTGNIREIK